MMTHDDNDIYDDDIFKKKIKDIVSNDSDELGGMTGYSRGQDSGSTIWRIIIVL